MGNHQTAPVPPASSTPPEIYTQLGKNNLIEQHYLSQGLNNINLYLCIVVVAGLLIIIFVLIRYINTCLNKRIEKRAQGEIFKQQVRN